nr:hypothetical protein BaRGS_023395 [Batillaria attramentaria]
MKTGLYDSGTFRRPTSVESDYQDIPAPQPALEELDNSRGMTADTPTVHSEGPYAGINEDEILVEDAEESKDEKGNEWNNIGSLNGRQANKPDEEENVTCKDPELGAAIPDYVPIRDIAERKRRAKEGKAKRATIIWMGVGELFMQCASRARKEHCDS